MPSRPPTVLLRATCGAARVLVVLLELVTFVAVVFTKSATTRVESQFQMCSRCMMLSRENLNVSFCSVHRIWLTAGLTAGPERGHHAVLLSLTPVWIFFIAMERTAVLQKTSHSEGTHSDAQQTHNPIFMNVTEKRLDTLVRTSRGQWVHFIQMQLRGARARCTRARTLCQTGFGPSTGDSAAGNTACPRIIERGSSKH